MIDYNAVRGRFSEIEKEFRSNPRLRWGFWVILAIVWFYGVLVLRDAQEAKANAYRLTSKQVERLRQVTSEPQWPERLEKARTLQLQVEGRLWRESTIGLAQAAFQDWLSQLTRQAAVGKPTISVSAQEHPVALAKSSTFLVEAPGNALLLWKVSGKVTFEFDPKAGYSLLEQLHSSSKGVVVESFTVRLMPAPRAEMVIIGYFQKPEATLAATTLEQSDLGA